MGELITVSGRILKQSNKSHDTLTYTITETDINASNTFGNSNEILIDKISLHCDCSGNYSPTETYVGIGDSIIKANTKRVNCNGKSILVKGDKIEILCNGTITETSTGATRQGIASVTVAIDNPNQSNIYANKS